VTAFGDDQPLAAPDTGEVRPETGLQLAGAYMQDNGHVVIVTTSKPAVKGGVGPYLTFTNSLFTLNPRYSNCSGWPGGTS